MSYLPSYSVTMNLHSLRVSGPYSTWNLSIFLFHGGNAHMQTDYATLGEAMANKDVLVHESGQVDQLEIENRLSDADLFIQAGEVVRGGWQDRTFAVDFVVPARSGRVPIPAFCVERSRWGRRRREDECSFSSSGKSVATKDLRRSVSEGASQGKVWAEVGKVHEKLSASLGESVCSMASPSSHELAMDHPTVQARRTAYFQPFSGLPAEYPDAVGMAYCVNGRFSVADLYDNPTLFTKLWRKLLDAAILEAMAESVGEAGAEPSGLGADQIVARLRGLSEVAAEEKMAGERVRIVRRRSAHGLWVETYDQARSSTPIHLSALSN